MMFTHILRLESLKQRHLALSLAAIFGATLFITLLRQLVAHQAIQEGLAGMFVLLAVGGIPLLAALLGGSAGATLRTTTSRMIEEALPFHPGSKFMSAYLISLLHFACFAVLIVAGIMLTGAMSGIDALVDFRWRGPVLIIAILQLHALSFAFSYVSKLTIVGIASALAVCGLQLSLFLMPRQGRLMYWLEESYTVTMFYFIAAISPFLFFATVAALAKHFQRDGRPPITMFLLLIILLLGGSFTLYGQSLWFEKRFEKELNPEFILSRLYNPEEEDVLKRGAIFSTGSGNLVQVMASGEKIRLGRAPYTSGKATYGPGNTVWVLSEEESQNKYAVRYAKDGKLHDFTVFSSADVEPDHILVRGTNIFLFGMKLGRKPVYAVLSERNTQPVWQKNVVQSLERSFEAVIESGEAAYASGDHAQLLQKLPDGSIRRWSLPGTAEAIWSIGYNVYPPAYETEEGPEFLVPVRDSESKQRLIVCQADGTLMEPWPDVRVDKAEMIRVYNLPGGGAVAVLRPEGSLYVLDGNGNKFPPLQVSPLFSKDAKDSFVYPRRLSGQHLWVMINSRSFVRFDLRSGAHKMLAELGERSWTSLNSAEEGIYFTRGGKIRLLDWNGNQHVLTSATLD